MRIISRRACLKIRDLHIPINNAKKIFQSLKSDYPKLDAHLVVSSYAAQFEIESSAWLILKSAPSIFVATKLREELLLIHDAHSKFKSRNESIKSEFISTQINTLGTRIEKILEEIEITETATVGLIFGELDYGLISQLQQDHRVDHKLTPQSGASIRIILGTLASLATKNDNSYMQVRR